MTKKVKNGKPKMLIFHPVIAPYRIDQFNSLSKLFDLEVVFLFKKFWNFNLDQQHLIKDCQFKFSYLLKGPRHKGRLFRFGMYRKIREVKPDIIVGYEYSFTTQYLIFLKTIGLIRQNVGSMIDDSPDICIHVQSRLRRLIRDRSVRNLDFLVVLSEEVAQFHRDQFMLEEKQVVISPILQLPERLRRDSEKIELLAQQYIYKYQLQGKKVALFVGRFIPEKALLSFITAITPILSQNDDYRIVLVGEGREKESLLTVVKENNLEKKVLFPGKFQVEGLYGWYACVSGFFLPSLSETFGAVVNEALIFGLRVFCSQYAGAATLINSQNGIIFNPSDSGDVVSKFQIFIDSLQAVDRICLADRPPLINDHMPNFINEWRKIIYE